MRSVVVAIDDFLSKSDLRRTLKFSRGRSRSSTAMRIRGNSSRSSDGGTAPGLARSAVTAWSSCSIRERLGIGTLHARPQIFEGAELKLLHGSLGSSELLGNFANAFLLNEAHSNDAPLVRG